MSSRLKFGYVYPKQIQNNITMPVKQRMTGKCLKQQYKHPSKDNEMESLDKQMEGNGILSNISKAMDVMRNIPMEISSGKDHYSQLGDTSDVMTKKYPTPQFRSEEKIQSVRTTRDAMKAIQGKMNKSGGALKLAGQGVTLPGGGVTLPGGGVTLPGGGKTLGDSMLPGDKLKLKVLEKMAKEKKKSLLHHKQSRGGGIGRRQVNEPMYGNGLQEKGGVLVLKTAKLLYPKLFKMLKLDKLIEGKGISGAGINNMEKLLNMRMKKIYKKNDKNIGKYLKPLSKEASNVMCPILMKMSKHNISGSGKNILKRILEKELLNAYKNIIKEQKGQGKGKFLGKDKKWWKEFGKGFVKGFKKVAKPSAKILGGIAMASGQPEIGVPLEILGNML